MVRIDRCLGSETYYLFDLSILFAQGGELILLRLWIHFCYCCAQVNLIHFFCKQAPGTRKPSLEIQGYFIPACRRTSAPPKRSDLEDPARLRIDPWPLKMAKTSVDAGLQRLQMMLKENKDSEWWALETFQSHTHTHTVRLKPLHASTNGFCCVQQL